MHFLGEIIGILFMLVWIPYAGWKAGTAVGWVISTPIRKRAERLKKTITPPKPLKKKIVSSSKPVHSSYPVETSFKEEYRITNPVEFDA